MPDTPRPHYDLLIRYGLSEASLHEAVQSDPAVKAEAEAELAATVPFHDDRCHMTRDYAQALRRALA
jgi:hypothetical protein